MFEPTETESPETLDEAAGGAAEISAPGEGRSEASTPPRRARPWGPLRRAARRPGGVRLPGVG